MPDARSFGPVAEQMTAALERYSKEELIDLLTHIVKTYVVEGTLPLKPEVGTSTGEDHLADLSFPQLILHHQMRLDHREWQRFSVSGEDVWVTIGGQRLNLTERPGAYPPAQETEGYMEPMGGRPRRQAPAAAAEGAAQPAQPAQPAPPQQAPAATTQPAAPAQPAAAPNQESSAPQRMDGIVTTEVSEREQLPDTDDAEASERFGMLEFD